MIRRHFITGVNFKPNVTITYHSEKAITINENEYVGYLSDSGYNDNIDEFYTNHIYPTFIITSHNFLNGIGIIEIYCKSKKFEDGTKCIGFTSMSGGDVTSLNDIFITDTPITYFKIDNITHIGYTPELVTKIIFPETLINNSSTLVSSNLVNKIIIPPYLNYKLKYEGSVQTMPYTTNSNAEIIFTGDLYQKISNHKNSNIKCPPHLLDKYKEYYTKAVAANNIIYLKIKDIRYEVDKNSYTFDYSNITNITEEGLYIVRNKIDNNTEELSIVLYDDIINCDFKKFIYNTEQETNGSAYRSIDKLPIVDYIFPSSITSIDLNLFGPNITKLVIPENVIEIKGYFSGYILSENFINNSSLILSESLKSKIIENGKDENGCVVNSNNELIHIRNGLYEDIIIPDYVTTIKANVINTYIKNSLYISKNVTDIILTYGNYHCETNNLYVDKDNPIYDSRDNCNAVIKTDENKMIFSSNNTFIPDNVIILGNGLRINNLINLNNVKIIESNAISVDRNSKGNLFISKHITKLFSRFIFSDSFDKCNITISVDKENTIYDDRNGSNVIVETETSSLILSNSNIIPEGVKIIKSYSFAYNIIIKPERILYIPSTIETIERDCFSGLENIEKIIYNGTIEEWNRINNAGEWFNYTNTNIITCLDGDIVIDEIIWN